MNAKETRKLKVALAEIFVQVVRIDERIAKDQEEIERLRTETREMLAQLKARKNSFGGIS